MNKSIILVLVALLGCAMCTYGSSSVDLYLSSYNPSYRYVGNDWYGLRLNCYGGSGDYYYRYSNIPSWWKDYDRDDFEDN